MSQIDENESEIDIGEKELNPIVVSPKSTVALPWIVSFAFNVDITQIKNPGYQVECKACNTKITWGPDIPTSNLLRHLKTTNKLKHAKVLEEIQRKSPTTKEKNAKRRLEDTFDATSKFTNTNYPSCSIFASKTIYDRFYSIYNF
jgi:hypothetical protein